MVTIELVAKCDQCQAEAHQVTDYLINNAPAVLQFIKQLRGRGWRLARDQNFRLSLTLCPKCALEVRNVERG